jgi:Xaa-Pro aminopeptidase
MSIQESVLRRREALFARMEEGSFAIFFAGEAPHKTTDQYYPFTVNRNFHYLTGLSREQFVLVLIKGPAKTFEYLFIEEPSDYATKWLGRRMTKEEASAICGIPAAQILYLDAFQNFLVQNVLANSRRALTVSPKILYLDLYRHKPLVKSYALSRMEALLAAYPELQVKNACDHLDALRLHKDDAEIAMIQQAIDVQEQAVRSLFRLAKNATNEAEFEALFEYELKRRGSDGNSFNPIVAAGKNAAVLHYEDNDKPIEKGALILCDMGALVKCYASDITRTFPQGGRFTPRQKQLYELVLSVNKACVAAVKPGIFVADLNALAKRLLAEGAKAIGLIDDPAQIDQYYYHNVSHYLGLDVHDVGSYQIPLKEGVVLTIEPGIYVEAEGIGIRIEDNVLVTKDGHVNLSRNIPKEVAELETSIQA